MNKVDFFIVGAPKAGTTSLYYYLDQHPEINMSSIKEPNFFSHKFINKQKLYYQTKNVERIEDYHNLFKKPKEKLIYGEASVSYLFYDVAQSIKEYNPNAKIIIILRDPVSRSFSHYLMDYKLGFVKDSFLNIVERRSKDDNSDLFYQQYIELSKYFNQVERYYQVFDTKNILIINYKDFINDTKSSLFRVADFLGVDTEYNFNFKKKHNRFSIPRNKFFHFMYSIYFIRKLSYLLLPLGLRRFIKAVILKNNAKPIMPYKTQERLKAFFKEDLIKLDRLLNSNFTTWIK